jgi:unsaturated pyranuronate lyase
MTRHPALYRWDEIVLEKVTEMVARKVVAGDQATIAQAYLKKGAIVPVHVHPVERLVYVLQGALRLRLGDEDMTVREGDVLVLPAGLIHQAECLDDTFVVTFASRLA